MKIAVYCSAKDAIPEEYKALGDALGKWLAQAGHSLVYGGATGGLMTRVSDAFKRTPKQPEQKLTGVIPHRIISMGRLAEGCDELIEVNDMAERKRTMREMADCFIVLPGSYGTLDELFDVVASGTVGEHKKPLLVWNHQGFYDELVQLSTKMHEKHFLPTQETYKPIFADTLDQLTQMINNFNKITQ